MKLLKKSMLLCICVALLATTMLTSCGFLEDVVNAITPPDGNDASNEVVLPDYKDFGDDPYRIEIKDGVAVVDFNPCCVEPFVLEIPETDENGNPVTAVQRNPVVGMLPTVISEEDFAEFKGRMEQYYGLTFEEAMEITKRQDLDNPAYEQAFFLRKYLSYFVYKSLNDCTTDHLKAELLERYPITEKMNIYVLDSSALSVELIRIYGVTHKAAPELTDVWYYEACLRAEQPYSSGLGETVAEIRFPSGITKIENLTFAGCHGLKTVTVPGNVKTVGSCAFAACDSLEEVTFEEGVTTIDYYALYDSSQIKTVNLPASLESLMLIFNSNMVSDSAWELPTINYGGTMAQWEELFRGFGVDPDEVEYGDYAYFDIHCSDGVVKATLTRQ